MNSQSFRILVVEDDEEINELECDLLRAHGMEAVPALSGAEALETCGELDFDAIMLDIMLPRRDGFDTCKELRRKWGDKLSIVMITALDGDDCRRRGFEAGADAYFTKPFDPDEVVETLRGLLVRSSGGNGVSSEVSERVLPGDEQEEPSE
jgi:DNA-binding response OmpR family regulator